MKRVAVHLAVLLVVVPTAMVGARPRTSATLEVAFASQVTATSVGGEPIPYTVSGCGFDASLGGVTVVVHSPVAISFGGDVPDGDGCIRVADVFSTQGAGHYEVDAFQQVRQRSRLMASTSFDL
jgi:hypothetical protein